MSYFTHKDFKDNDIGKALLALKEELYQEEQLVRSSQMPYWKRNEAFWHGLQKGQWDEISRDYLTSSEVRGLIGDDDIDWEDYERCVNIFRAHGEAIIAALSASLPSVKFSPQDADSYEDISTSKAYQSIAELIAIHNEAPLKVIKALFHLYLHGVAFSYKVYHRDEKFGIIREPKYDMKKVFSTQTVCPVCGSNMDEQEMEMPEQMGMGQDPMMMNQGMPQDPMDPMMGQEQQMMPPGMKLCQVCQNVVQPQEEQIEEEIPQFHSWDETPKGRTLIEVYGPVNVTVPHDVKDLDHAGFLRLDSEVDIALVNEIYPEVELKATSPNQDREDRKSILHRMDDGSTKVTVTRHWFRPWMFNRIVDKEIVKDLKKKFPNGAYVVILNEDKIAEACDENLSDVWTETKCPTNEFIHADPIANPLVPIQTMTNDLVGLTLNYIEAGIPINIFDIGMLDPEYLRSHPPSPNDWIPGKAPAGKRLSDAVTSNNPVQMGRGIQEFNQYLEQQGQFVLGSFPGVWGGAAQSGSKTFGEYKESIERALQRLSIPWKSICNWWGQTLLKASTMFINNMIEDEFYAKDVGNNTFINVWIRKAQLNGKIGNYKVENSDQIPTTWAEQRSMMMDLIQQGNEQFLSTIFHPENVGLLWNLMGIYNLYVPGNRDRDKQLREIFEMMKNEPSVDEMGMPSSSVMIEQEFDDHTTHFEVVKAFLNGEVGQQLKVDNPQAFENIKMHGLEHFQMMQMQQAPPEEGQPEANQEQGNVNA